VCEKIEKRKLFGSAIILAGGKSSRMGFDKQFMEVNEKKLIEITADRLAAVFEDIIIVTNRPEMYKGCKYKIATDIIRRKGPLGGIHAGLLAASSEFAYVLACDMPHINVDYIEYMKDAIESRVKSGKGADACITLKGEWIEPFNAFYRKSIAKSIKEHLESDRRAVYSLIENLNTLYVSESEARRFSPDWSMFFNMNTMDEFLKFKKISEAETIMKKSRFYNITKYNDGKLTKQEDEIVAEYWLDLFVDEVMFVRLLCTPESLESLAVGFLKSDGIIASIEDVKNIRVDSLENAVFVDTKNPEITREKVAGKKVNIVGTSKGIVSDSLYEASVPEVRLNPKLDIEKILDLVEEFSSMSGLFSSTGGAHSCAVSDGQRLLDFKEDIGRHNAVDKVVGSCMIAGIDTSDKLLILSGRVSSEMLLKAMNAGFCAVISRAAPTDAAVDIARSKGVILCGFVRGRKMNMYTDFPSLHF